MALLFIEMMKNVGGADLEVKIRSLVFETHIRHLSADVKYTFGYLVLERS